MKIVLADVNSIQPGQLDAVADKTAKGDKFSRFFDKQLSQEEALSRQVKTPQVVEKSKEKMAIVGPVADLDQAGARVDDLHAEILANPAEAESLQLTSIIDRGVQADAVEAANREDGEALPSDGNLLPPAVNQGSQWSVQFKSAPAQHQPAPVSEPITSDEQQSISVQRPSITLQHLSSPVQQQPIPVEQQSVEQLQPLMSNVVNTASLKSDGTAHASIGKDSVLMAKASLSNSVVPSVLNKSDFMVDKLNFGNVADFQFTAPSLNGENDMHNNLFRLHSPAGLSSLNLAPQSLPPQLESLPLPNLRDQAALSGGLGDRIHWMVNQKLNTATIRMDPPMLGRLEVHIQVTDDVTNVTIHTQHAQTRDLIENASIRLRDYLQENGYENVNVDVSQQQQQQATDQDVVRDDFQADDTLAGTEPDLNREAVDNRFYSSDSVVDYFV